MNGPGYPRRRPPHSPSSSWSDASGAFAAGCCKCATVAVAAAVVGAAVADVPADAAAADGVRINSDYVG